MVRIACAVIILLVLPVAYASTFKTESVGKADIVGEAFSVDGDQLIYREYHYLNSLERTHRVIYSWPNGVEFAEKSVDYSTGYTTPSFSQKDRETGETFAVDVKQDAITVRQIQPKRETASEKTLSPDGRLVVDAGFDHFVRRYWQELVAGQVLDFEFPSAQQQAMYDLRIRHKPCDVEVEKARADDRECFLIEPQNWFARIWVDAIELVYLRSQQRLLRYTGIANILPANESSRVAIHYSYADSQQEK